MGVAGQRYTLEKRRYPLEKRRYPLEKRRYPLDKQRFVVWRRPERGLRERAPPRDGVGTGVAKVEASRTADGNRVEKGRNWVAKESAPGRGTRVVDRGRPGCAADYGCIAPTHLSTSATALCISSGSAVISAGRRFARISAARRSGRRSEACEAGRAPSRRGRTARATSGP